MSRRTGPWMMLVALLSTAASCFSPREAPCAFTCISAEKRCPEGYLCGDDGLCHRITTPGDEGVCLLTAPDAATSSALSSDAAAD